MPGRDPLNITDPLFLMEQRVRAVQGRVETLRKAADLLDQRSLRAELNACELDLDIVRSCINTERCERAALRVRASHG